MCWTKKALFSSFTPTGTDHHFQRASFQIFSLLLQCIASKSNFIDLIAREIIYLVAFIGPFSWVYESYIVTTSMVQDYIVHHPHVLCTTDGAQGGCCGLTQCPNNSTDIHFGGAKCSFVLTRLCTRRFCMKVISSNCDGAQYDVVSLALVCWRSQNNCEVLILKGIQNGWASKTPQGRLCCIVKTLRVC